MVSPLRTRRRIVADEEENDAPLSRLLGLKKRKKGFKEVDEVSRVSHHHHKRFRVVDADDDESAATTTTTATSFNTGDLVWGKIFSDRWCPAQIRRKHADKFSISFYGYKRNLRVHESELLPFETHFAQVSDSIRSMKLLSVNLSDGIDSALAELGRKVSLTLTCPCQDDFDEQEEESMRIISEANTKKEEEFQPVDVLEFVRAVAVSPCFDEVDEVSRVKSGARVNAFRRYSSIRCDWIYRETMRITESGGESQQDANDYSAATGENEDASDSEQENNTEVSDDQVETYLDLCKRICVDPLLHEVDMEEDDPEPEQTHLNVDESTSPLEEVAMEICDDLEDMQVLSSSESDYGTNYLVTSNEEQEDTVEVSSEQVTSLEPMQGLLTHLRCLARDPFYSGTEGSGMETVCQKIFRYKELVYKNVLDSVPVKHSSSLVIDIDGTDEEEEEQNVSRHNLVAHLSNVASKSLFEETKALKNRYDTEEVLPHDVEVDIREEQKVSRESSMAYLSNAASGPLAEESIGLKKTFDTQGMPSHNSSEEHSESQEANFPNEEQEYSLEGFARQFTSDSATLKENSGEPLCEMLTHLLCLAVDPFYTGAKGSGMENSSSVCQKILRYRGLAYQNVLDPISTHYTSYHGHLDDISNAQKLAIQSSTIHLTKAASTPIVEKIRQEVSKNAVLLSQEATTKRKQVADLHTANHDKYQLFSNIPEDPLKNQPCNKGDRRTQDMEIDSRSHDSGLLVGKTMSQNSRAGVSCGASSKSPPLPHFCGNPSSMCPRKETSSVACMTNKVKLGIDSKGSSKENARLTRPSTNPSMSEQAKTYSLTMLYSSPLSMDSRVSSGNSQLQPSARKVCSDVPATLNMKFPKDFKLPSKDDLLKEFRPFGQLDYLKSKVFFFTGSAQVVFLRHIDAEAAYRYAQTTKIFLGGGNVRFWLVRHDHLRQESANNSTSLSATTNLKSCLKTWSSEGKNDKREVSRVKFLPGNQISSTGTTEVSTREVQSDISLKILALLEQNNQVMCRTKKELGLGSFYSLFAHSYNFPKAGDERKQT